MLGVEVGAEDAGVAAEATGGASLSPPPHKAWLSRPRDGNTCKGLILNSEDVTSAFGHCWHLGQYIEC